MANKIVEVLTEPNEIYKETNFLLKIKVIKYITYNEAKTKAYNEIKNYTYNELKGV